MTLRWFFESVTETFRNFVAKERLALYFFNKLLTGGNRNNSEPAWELDGNAIVFASEFVGVTGSRKLICGIVQYRTANCDELCGSQLSQIAYLSIRIHGWAQATRRSPPNDGAMCQR